VQIQVGHTYVPLGPSHGVFQPLYWRHLDASVSSGSQTKTDKLLGAMPVVTGGQSMARPGEGVRLILALHTAWAEEEWGLRESTVLCNSGLLPLHL
jgi:hypothetical protein